MRLGIPFAGFALVMMLSSTSFADEEGACTKLITFMCDSCSPAICEMARTDTAVTEEDCAGGLSLVDEALAEIAVLPEAERAAALAEFSAEFCKVFEE